MSGGIVSVDGVDRARRAANRADEDAAALAVVLAVLTARRRVRTGAPAHRLGRSGAPSAGRAARPARLVGIGTAVMTVPGLPTVILASASPARRAVLQAAGIDPVVLVSGVDEDARGRPVSGDAPAQDVVVALATAKAEAVAAEFVDHYPDAVVIGCDSMLHLDGALLGKPHTAQEARSVGGPRWPAAPATCSPATPWCGSSTACPVGTAGRDVVPRRSGSARPTPAELDAYIATGEPLAVAGAFTIDGLGGWFVDGVDGDPSSVVGISLPLTRRLLADHRAGRHRPVDPSANRPAVNRPAVISAVESRAGLTGRGRTAPCTPC